MDESRMENGMTLTISSPEKQGVESREGMEDSSCNVPGQKDVDVVAPKENEPKATNKQPYQCHLCQQYFDRSFDFITHLRTHIRYLRANTILFCFICGAKFTNDEEVSAHLETHQPDEIPRCNVCCEPYNHFTKRHTGPKPFKCSMCLKIYQKSTDFHFHVRSHSGDYPNVCHICEKSFSRKDRLRQHKEIEHGIKIHRCEKCNKCFESELTLEQHRKSHDELVYVKCDVCTKVFHDTESLGKHRMCHNQSDSFTCKFCDIKFNTFSLLEEHIKTHYSEPSHACNVCKRRFLSVDKLNNHRKLHKKIKRKTSERKTPQKRIIAPELPFKCGQCQKSFLNAASLHRHEYAAHRDARHTCELCGLEFSHPENLKAHTANIHAGKSSTHQCSLCGVKFKSAIELNNHNAKNHPGVSEGSVEGTFSSNNNLSTKTPASATRSLPNSNEQEHTFPKKVKNEEVRKHVHPSGSTSVVSISGIYRGSDLHASSPYATAEGEREQGELDHSSEQNINSAFVCRFCGKCFSLHHYCRLHRKRHKEFEIVVKCFKCHKAFGQHDQFTHHRCTDGKTNPYECEICDEQFTSSFMLLRHRSVHKGPKYQCDRCKRTFTRQSNLDRHNSVSHAWGSELRCTFCPRYFFSKHAHRVHLRTHAKANTCAVCNIAFPSPDNFAKHMKDHHMVGNMYKCQACKVEFTSVQSYQIHQLSHITNNLHTCDMCGKGFMEKKQLARHWMTHWGNKLQDISCTWCGMKYSALSSLHRHRQRNMCWRGRSFPCVLCGQKFERLDLLQTHTKTHVDSSISVPVQLDSSRSVVNSNDYVGDEMYENSIEQDRVAQVSHTLEIAKERQSSQCQVGIVTDSEFLNEEDVSLDDEDLLGSDFPGQSPTSSVMFSCGECNNEFSTLQELQRHIQSHNTKSQNATACMPHSSDIEPQNTNTESLECDMESQASENRHQSHPQKQNIGSQNQSVKHNISVHNHLDQLPMSLGSKDIPGDGYQLNSGLFKCGLCEETFHDIVELNDHISKHEDNQNLYKCDLCGNVLQSIISYHNHCISHITSDTDPGSKSDNTTTTTPQRVNVFEMAFLTPSETDSDSCPTEGGISTNNTTSKKSKDNNNVSNLEDNSKPAKEERLGIFDLLTLDSPIKTNDVSCDILKCNICEKTFESKSEHQRHKKQHTSEKETQVDEHIENSQTNVSSGNNTGRNDNTSSALTSIKLYKCGKCDLSFGVPSELKCHSRMHLLTVRSATYSAVSDFLKNSTTSASRGGGSPELETLLRPTTSSSSGAPQDTVTHACRACACVFLSADALYSHCHEHVTSPTVKISRLGVLDSNISGSILLEDLPSGVYTRVVNTKTAIHIEDTRNASHEMVSSSGDNNDHHIAKLTNENKTFVGLLRSQYQHASASGLNIHMEKGHTDMTPSSISNPSVSENARLMPLSNRLGSNNPSRDSNNSYITLKSLLKCTVCSRLFPTVHGLDVHHRIIHPTYSKQEGLLVQTRCYSCKDCEKFFLTSRSLNLHKTKSHSKFKDLHKCNTCGLEFMSASRLLAHNSIHTNGGDKRAEDNPFECLLCERVFATFHDVRIHCKYHTGEERTDHLPTADHYRCLLCRISFSTVLHLRYHVNKYHNNLIQESEQTSGNGDISYLGKPETAGVEGKNDRIFQSAQQVISFKESSAGRTVYQDDKITSCPTPSSHTLLSLSSQTLSALDTGPRNRPCKCMVCNRVFQSAFEIGEGCRQCQNDPKVPFPFKCLTCSRIFSSIKGIRIHILKHPSSETSQKRLFSDDRTTHDRSSPKVPKLATQLNGVHQSTYHCWICVQEFSSSQELTIHMKTHPGNSISKTIRQPWCTSSNGNTDKDTQLVKSLQDRVNPAVSFRTGTMRYKCRLCPRLFPSPLHMLRHLKTHTQKHQCDMCGEMFSDVWTYQTHRAAHKVTATHMCHICKKEYPTLSSLVRHRKAHTGKSLPYRCDTCSDEFVGVEDLTVHCKTHRGNVQDMAYVIDDDDESSSNTDKGKRVQGKVCDENEQHDTHHSQSKFAEMTLLLDEETDKSIKCDSESLTYAKLTSDVGKQQLAADVENKEARYNRRDQENGISSNAQIGSKRQYKCDICNQAFRTLQEVGEHCRSHMENKDIKTRADADLFKSMKVPGTHVYKCNICDRDYMALYSIQRHYRVHEGELMYICHVCDKTFHQPAGLRQHLLTHNQDALFKCHVCGQKYNSMKTFKTHKKTHSHGSTESCVRCCKDFACHKEFLDHKAQCEKERKSVCDICGKGFTRTYLLTEHRRIHEDTRRYRCYTCGNRYTHMPNLKRHMETAHNHNISLDTIMKMTHGSNKAKATENMESSRDTGPERAGQIKKEGCPPGARTENVTMNGASIDHRHKCVRCNKNFPSLAYLRRHMAEHEKEGVVFSCSICGENFKDKILLQKHVKSMHAAKHTKANQCCVCGIIYKESSILEKHLWIVHRERLFSCDICQGRFGNNDALKRHMLQKHDATSHKCPECFIMFSSPERLQRHIAALHPQQPYACTICNIQFQSMSEKQRHMNSTHAQRVNARVKSVQWATKLSSRINKNPNTVQSTGMSHVKVPDIPVPVHSLSVEALQEKNAGDKQKRLLSCKICSQTFNSTPDRQRHMIDVHDATYYRKTCSTCGQMFASKARLKTHETLHTGKKPFPCPFCHNVYRTRSGLQVHLQYHTGERKYSCSICNKSFVMKNHLQLHIRRAHPGQFADTHEAESD